MRVGLLAAGLSCLMIGNAWAEREVEGEYAREGQSAQSQQSTAERAATEQQGQQYTAQFRGTQPAAESNKEVEQYFATCLLKQNEAEVEIAQFAQQQTQNPEVKQFAQMLVQDHRQLIQKLQPLAGQHGARSNAPSLGAQSQTDAQRQASDTTRLPGASAAGQPNRNVNQNLTGIHEAGQPNAALHEVAQIQEKIGERCVQALREELQQKEGAEFDKCFVGSQVSGHMHMLAELEVLEQQGPDQVKQIAQQARPKVQQHLEHAKQLMKQLESSSPTSQAERQPSRTQR
jgi:predicted outer membrane protein